MPDGGIAWGTECRDQLEADLVGSVFTQFEIGEIEELRVRLEVRSGREERTLTAIITDLICNLYRQSQHQEGDASVEVTWDGCSYPVDPDVNQEQGGEDPRYIIEVLQRLGYIACGWPAGPDNQAIYCSLKVGSELTSLTESLATTRQLGLWISGERKFHPLARIPKPHRLGAKVNKRRREKRPQIQVGHTADLRTTTSSISSGSVESLS